MANYSNNLISRTRLVAMISGVLFLMSLSVVGVFASDSSCFALSGATTQRSGDQYLDEGSLDFNDTGLGGDASWIPYQHCVERSSSFSDTRINLKGWVWNTNLGWISMNSEGASAPYNNFGVSTGNYPYSSYIELNLVDGELNPAPGEYSQMYGYFYGDNTGWIRLNCAASDLDDDGAVDDTNTCASSNYGVRMDSAGNLSGYGWSDSVKWINFDGVQIDPDAILGNFTAVVSAVPIQYSGYGTGATILEDGSNPRADGLGAYTLKVQFMDGSENVTAAVFSDTDLTFTFGFTDGRKLNLEEEVTPLDIDVFTSYLERIEAMIGSGESYTLIDLMIYLQSLSLDRYGASNWALQKSDFTLQDNGDSDPANDSLYISSFKNYVKSYVPASGDELKVNRVNLWRGGSTPSIIGVVPVDVPLEFNPPFDLEMYQGEASRVSGSQTLCEERGQTSNVLDLQLGVNEPVTTCGTLYRGEDEEHSDLYLNDFRIDVGYDFEALTEEDFFGASFWSDREGSSVYEGDVIPFKVSNDFAEKSFYPFVEVLNEEADEDGDGTPDSIENINLDDLFTDAKVFSSITYTIPVRKIDYTPGGTPTMVEYKLDVSRPGPSLSNVFFRIGAANISGNVQSNAFQQIKSDIGVRDTGRAGSVRTTARESTIKGIKEFTRGNELTCVFNSIDNFLANPASVLTIGSDAGSKISTSGSVGVSGATFGELTKEELLRRSFVKDDPSDDKTPAKLSALSALSIEDCLVKGGSNLYVAEFTKKYPKEEFIKVSDLRDSEGKLFFGRNGTGSLSTVNDGSGRVAGYVRGGDSNPTVNENSTLVLVGANLIIDRDIFYTDGGEFDASKATGIAVLANNAGRGGNIYITSNVSDLRVHLYADGSVFSMENSVAGIDAKTKLPNRISQDNSVLHSQLALAGSMLSQNTVGGSVEEPPKLGDNSIAPSVDAAKNYDLNFWRFSPLTYDIRAVAVDADGDGELDEREFRVFMCGPEAPGYPDGYPVSDFFSDDDPIFAGPSDDRDLYRVDELCWLPETDGAQVRLSRYMNGVRNQLGASASDWKVVNIMFDKAPISLPVFGG